MKNLFSRISSLLIAVCMIFGMTATTFAEDKKAYINFLGEEEGFEFISEGEKLTETDLFPEFKNVLPGDTLTQVIEFTNKAEDCDYVKLYMKAVPHSEENLPQIRADLSEMNEFLSKLSMEIYNEDELIFSGSPNSADGLSEYVPLGKIKRDKKAVITAKLHVPAELGNEISNMAGEVDWVFLAECFYNNNLTVNKVWTDGNQNHPRDQVEIELLRDGKAVESTVLSAKNNWTYTFFDLDEDYRWTVREVDVPYGYRVDYHMSDKTNKYLADIIIVENSPRGGIINYKQKITVRKVWEDNNSPDRPDSIEFSLFEDGRRIETVELNEENNWTHRFTDLSTQKDYDIKEINVPEGYKDSYEVNDDEVIIKNTKKGVVPEEDLTVTKKWEDSGKGRPESVTAGLYDGKKLIETVKLSDENNWTYTWQNLPTDRNWLIREINIPKGYSPVYNVNDNVVTITNVYKLVETGQLNWPVPVMAGCGAVLLISGAVIMYKKRK